MPGGSSRGSSAATPVGTQVIQQKSEPWEAQKQYLPGYYARAQELSNQPRQYYPNPTYVPFSNQTEDSLAATENRAREGSPIQAAGRESMLSTIRGDFLRPESNPFLRETYMAASDPLVEQFTKATAPGIDAQFIKAGRYGSGLWQDQQSTAQRNLGRTLADLGTGIFGGNFQAERGRQVGAAQAAPQYAAADYNDIAKLFEVGREREGLGERQLSDAINRYMFNQEEPMTRLGNAIAQTSGDFGRTQMTSVPIYRGASNTFGDVLGGLGGLGLLASGIGGFFRRGGMVRKPKSYAWGT